jgi:uncharacterized membrane protein YqhA
MKTIAALLVTVGVFLVIGYFIGPFEVSSRGSTSDFEFAMVSDVGLCVGLSLIAIGSIIFLRRFRKEKQKASSSQK